MLVFILFTLFTIVKPDATEEQIERVIETGEVDKLYIKTTVDLQGQAKNALAYVEDRHRDIVAIEASVRVCLRGSES